MVLIVLSCIVGLFVVYCWLICRVLLTYLSCGVDMLIYSSCGVDLCFEKHFFFSPCSAFTRIFVSKNIFFGQTTTTTPPLTRTHGMPFVCHVDGGGHDWGGHVAIARRCHGASKTLQVRHVVLQWCVVVVGFKSGGVVDGRFVVAFLVQQKNFVGQSRVLRPRTFGRFLRLPGRLRTTTNRDHRGEFQRH